MSRGAIVVDESHVLPIVDVTLENGLVLFRATVKQNVGGLPPGRYQIRVHSDDGRAVLTADDVETGWPAFTQWTVDDTFTVILPVRISEVEVVPGVAV